jgi:hypothetical protein
MTAAGTKEAKKEEKEAKNEEKKESSTDKKHSGFLGKLKAKCKNCTSGSIKVYMRNIRRLFRLTEEGPVPLTHTWLKKKETFDKYSKLPLKTRRHLSVAAVKASQAYGIKPEKWETSMYKDASKYQVERNKNKKSDTEKALWPKKGYAALKDAAKEQWKRIKHVLADEPSLPALYKYQMFIVLKLFAEIPFRNTFATLEVEKTDENNYIHFPKKGNASLVIRKHKSSKHIGEREVKLSRAATMALRKFLRYREKVVDHKFFLSSKTGKKMSRPALGKALHRYLKTLTGKKGFGSRLIRILAATEKKDEIEAVSELSNKLLHSAGGKQTKQYVRK